MARQTFRERGAGYILRNTKGEPVGVRANRADGGKGTMFFRPSHAPVTEAEAERDAPRFADIIRNSVPASSGTTATEWWKTYLDAAAIGRVGKKTKGRPQITVEQRRARFKNYVEPHIGAKSMASITSTDLRPIVSELDELVRARGKFYAGELARDKDGTKPGLAPKTAQNIWGEVTSAFKEACSSKIDELLVRDNNPALAVQGPDTGDDREQAALYPSELTALLSCGLVPIQRRRLWALASYTGLRMSECRGLRAADVDFEHEMIHVRRQQRDGASETTSRKKTRAAKRSISIEPSLRPLLETLVSIAGDGPIVRVPPAEDCAELVRKDLKTASVERAELFADDDETMHFTAHGLRHTCITHWAVAGRTMQWIMACAGHTEWETTQNYLDAALMLRSTFGTPHPALPEALISDRTEIGQTGHFRRKTPSKSATPMGIEPMLPA